MSRITGEFLQQSRKRSRCVPSGTVLQLTKNTSRIADMVRTLLISLLVIGCGKKADAPTSGSDTTKSDPAKPDPAKPDPAKPDPTKPDPAKPDPTKPDPSPATPDPDPAATTKRCGDACAARDKCGIADAVADCTRDCEDLLKFAVLTEEGVALYAKASCDEVKKAETDVDATFACTRGCRKALECGVEGEMRQCLGFCGENLKKGAFTVPAVKAMTATDCDNIKKNVTLAAPAPTPTGARPGDACRRDGTQDCGSVWVCCRGGRVTRTGAGGGLCLSQGGCAMAAMARGI
jgi:hypothetical protein